MALVKCPECGKEHVSDMAEVCPNCGYGIRAHYIRLQEIKKQEDHIKRVTRPTRPVFGKGLAICLILSGMLPFCFLFMLDGDYEVNYVIIFFVLPLLGVLVAVVLCVLDYRKRIKLYNLAQTDFQEYKRQIIKRREMKMAKVKGSAVTANVSAVKPECPYCHSTNTSKISGASKAGSVAMFGIFAAGKVSKQWHCYKCGSDF